MAARWLLLIAASAAAIVILASLRISAALLIGPMAAAIALAGSGRPVRVPPPLFTAAQAIVGIMIARALSGSLFAEIGRNWWVFLLAVLSVLAAACALGGALTRWRVLPGTAALWGSFPGAATTMTLMAADFGADIRLVAFMQYFRVVLVALAASAVARIFVPASGDGGTGAGFVTLVVGTASIHPGALAATLIVAAIGATVGLVARLPAGALLGPMALGAVLHGLGLLTIELPPPLLAIAYALVGWVIGLRFDRAVIAHVVHALPRVAAALVALIGGCALLSVALSRLAGVDALTAYLAMSPGGADSVAIIAASSSKVDVSFIMALQVSRFLVILAFGPMIARFVARWAEPPSPAQTSA